jgi:F-type H+-transporting ATPase subunit c
MLFAGGRMMDKTIAIAALAALGFSAFGGALGQGWALSRAVEGIARNPQSRGQVIAPLIIGLSMIEFLVLANLIMTMFSMSKLPN